MHAPKSVSPQRKGIILQLCPCQYLNCPYIFSPSVSLRIFCQLFTIFHPRFACTVLCLYFNRHFQISLKFPKLIFFQFNQNKTMSCNKLKEQLGEKVCCNYRSFRSEPLPVTSKAVIPKLYDTFQSSSWLSSPEKVIQLEWGEIWTVECFRASQMIQMCSKVWEPLIKDIYRRGNVSLTIIWGSLVL